MSLRVRLTLVIAILFLLGTLLVMGRSLLSARVEIREEVEFSRQIASQFIELLTRHEESTPQQESIAVLRSQLTRMETAGRFAIDVTSSAAFNGSITPINSGQLKAPAWFLDVLGIDESQLLLFHELDDGQTLVVRVDPVGEINEIWDDTSYTITTTLGTLLTITMVVYLLIGHWMNPIGNIIAALDQLVKGDFSRRIPAIALSEINEVAQKINSLASVLGSSKSDNERLTRQAMSIQEQERRYLAQELHDSLGQSVSAIKAMAVSIANRTRAEQPMISESASNIERISDDAYKSVRNLMAWLRPAVLDELGLTLAVQQMVDDWNVHHEDTFCSLRQEADVSGLQEHQQIQVYRIVQEALTNVAKHAQASRVNITIAGNEIITLMISDDGKGFESSRVRMGIGLSNIRDRANLLHGTLTVSSKKGKGTTLQIEFPPRGERYRRRRDDN